MQSVNGPGFPQDLVKRAFSPCSPSFSLSFPSSLPLFLLSFLFLLSWKLLCCLASVSHLLLTMFLNTHHRETRENTDSSSSLRNYQHVTYLIHLYSHKLTTWFDTTQMNSLKTSWFPSTRWFCRNISTFEGNTKDVEFSKRARGDPLGPISWSEW